MSKQVVNIHVYTFTDGSSLYQIHSLSNRLEPKVGSLLMEREVKLLIAESKNRVRPLSVNLINKGTNLNYDEVHNGVKFVRKES